MAIPSARDRILDSAFQLFYARGIRAVGVDLIIAESGVAKATFYKHFPAKDELVLAYLDKVDGIWTGQLHAAAESAGPDPADALVGIFDALGTACQRDGFFIDVRSDDLPNVLRVQNSQHAEMIGRATTWVIEGAGRRNLIDRFSLRQAALKDLACQPHRERRVSRQTIKYPPAGKVGIVLLFRDVLILHIRRMYQEKTDFA